MLEGQQNRLAACIGRMNFTRAARNAFLLLIFLVYELHRDSVTLWSTTAASRNNNFYEFSSDNQTTQREKSNNRFYYNYNQANNTIVTAFFRIPTTRHTQDDYDQLLEKLCSLHDAMIIYTSPDLVPKFTALRGPEKANKTMIIPMQLNETMAANLFTPQQWQQARAKIRVGATSNDVLWVWHAKVELLKQGTDLNPFQSQFFAWVDAGMIRWWEYGNKTLLERIPPELPDHKVLIMNCTPIMGRKGILEMGGAFLGGDATAVNTYHDAYYHFLNQTARKDPQYTGWLDEFLVSEQKVMYHTCIQNPGLCAVVTPKKLRRTSFGMATFHPFFYMLAYLGQQSHQLLASNGFVFPLIEP